MRQVEHDEARQYSVVMTNVEKILQDARALSEEERTTVALELLASVSGPDPHAHLNDEELASEIERRAEDAAAGRTKGRRWDEIEADLRRKYKL